MNKLKIIIDESENNLKTFEKESKRLLEQIDFYEKHKLEEEKRVAKIKYSARIDLIYNWRKTIDELNVRLEEIEKENYVPPITTPLYLDLSFIELVDKVISITGYDGSNKARKYGVIEDYQFSVYLLRLCHCNERKITYKMICSVYGRKTSNAISAFKKAGELLETNAYWKEKYVPILNKFRKELL